MRIPKTDLISDILDNTTPVPDQVSPEYVAQVADPNTLSAFNRVAMSKLTAMIERGRSSAGAVIEKVQNEVPRDLVAAARAMSFTANGSVKIGIGEESFKFHRHALRQLAAILDMPQAWADTLTDKGEWGRKLLAHSFAECTQQADSRHMVRIVNGDVRAILSDKFRRLDSRPIVDAFVGACAAVGALPYEGNGGDTKIAIKAILPQVFEPVPGEMLAIGVALENSDFGAGACSVKAFILRLYCQNGAMMDTAMRQIHIGRRIDESMALSQRTLDLDTQATASAVNDIVRGALSAQELEKRFAVVRAAHAAGLDPKAAIERLKKSLTKGEVEDVTKAFTSTDITNLPAGQSVYRMAQAISWVAKSCDGDRKIELEKVAGQWLSGAPALATA